MDQFTIFTDNPEYDAFTQKFQPKRTTDDCYTPASVYEAVSAWVAAEYQIDRDQFVRPFWPGGDFQSFGYAADSVVVDNPPFSCFAEIIKFYDSHKIKFFLFAPALTLFSAWGVSRITYLPVGADITYDNGANVKTSFATNLDRWQVRTAPTLYKAVQEANDAELRKTRTVLPKYEYPDHIITAALVHKWGQHGVDFRVGFEDCARIRVLDAQKENGSKSGIYGSGFLLSERAAAERAAAERAAAERAAAERAAAERATATRWKLSDREWAIVRGLGGEHGGEKQTDAPP